MYVTCQVFKANPETIKKFFLPEHVSIMHGLVNPSKYVLSGEILQDGNIHEGFITREEYKVIAFIARFFKIKEVP